MLVFLASLAFLAFLVFLEFLEFPVSLVSLVSQAFLVCLGFLALCPVLEVSSWAVHSCWGDGGLGSVLTVSLVPHSGWPSSSGRGQGCSESSGDR